MENKELIIIALVILALAFFYWQIQTKSLDTQPNNQENEVPVNKVSESKQIQELKQQLNHYQTLYQNRVKKDLDAETLRQEYQVLAGQFKQLGQKNSELTTAFESKVKDLESQLIDLARQKVSKQKEASALLNQLETNWKQDKQNWVQEKTKLISEWNQKQENQSQLLSAERAQVNEKISSLEKVNQALTENLARKALEISEKFGAEREYKEKYQQAQEQLKKFSEQKAKESKELQQTHQLEINKHKKLREDYQKLEQEKTKIASGNLKLQKQLTESQEQIKLKAQEVERSKVNLQQLERQQKEQAQKIKGLSDQLAHQEKKATEYETQLVKEIKGLRETVKVYEKDDLLFEEWIKESRKTNLNVDKEIIIKGFIESYEKRKRKRAEKKG